jgi:hypothetical protein
MCFVPSPTLGSSPHRCAWRGWPPWPQQLHEPVRPTATLPTAAAAAAKPSDLGPVWQQLQRGLITQQGVLQVLQPWQALAGLVHSHNGAVGLLRHLDGGVGTIAAAAGDACWAPGGGGDM